jgi:hypothetical protein
MHTTKKDARDKLFHKFCADLDLWPQKNHPISPTFIGSTGSTQIDYILSTKRNMITDTEILPNIPLNTSDHVPVVANLQMELPIHHTNSIKRHRSLKIQWDKGDLLAYQKKVSSKLAIITTQDLDAATNSLVKALKASTQGTIPTKANKASGCKLPWSQRLGTLSTEAKTAHKEWVQAGRPDSEDEPLKLKMKACKRNFRSEQRRSQARIDEKFYNSIMEAEKDSKLFFKLIKSQRATSETKTNSLLVNSEVYEGSRVMEGWAIYQEALATPL